MNEAGTNWFTRLLIWASGADPDLINRSECRTVRARYVGIGGAVLSTMLLGGLAMGYLLNGVFGVWLAVPLGTLWGAIILNIDRYLVGSLVYKDNHGLIDRFKIALPRLMLAVLIAFCVSEPLVVAVFQKEIELQMTEDNLAEHAEALERIERRMQPELKQLAQEERVIRDELHERDSLVREAYDAAVKEADGLAGSMIRGQGPRYTDKMRRYELLLQEYETLKAQREDELASLREQREALVQQRRKEAREVTETARAADSFLRQHMALERLMKDPEVGLTVFLQVWLIRLLIFALEILPLFVKLMLPRGPYDALHQRIHDGEVEKLDAQRKSDSENLQAQRRAEDRIRAAAEEMAEQTVEAARDSSDLDTERETLAERLARVVNDFIDGRFRSIFRDEDDVESGEGRVWLNDALVGPEADYRDPVLNRFTWSDPGPRGPRFTVAEPPENGHKETGPSRGRRAMNRLRGARAAAWKTPARRIATVVSLLGLTTAGILAYPYGAKPCRTGWCDLAGWVEESRTQTRVLDRSGSLLWTIPDHPPADLDSLPDYLPILLEVVEDKRFRHHFGVDPLAVSAALANRLIRGEKRGASTIPMQVVRCLDLGEEMWPDRTWGGKIAETVMAIELDARLGKDEILTLHLNCVDLGWVAGQHVRGINEAAWTYFGKPARNISLAEAATLIGMIQGPQKYHPFYQPENARQRRDFVLKRLADERPEFKDAAVVALQKPLMTIAPDRIPKQPAPVSLVKDRFAGSTIPDTVSTTIDNEIQRFLEGELGTLIGEVESGLYGAYQMREENRLVAGGIIMEAGTGRLRGYECGRPLGLENPWDLCRKGSVAVSSVGKFFMVMSALEYGTLRLESTLRELKARAEAIEVAKDYLQRICRGSADRLDWTVSRLLAVSDNCLAVSVHQLLPPQAFEQLNELGLAIDPAKPASSLGTGTISLLELTELMAGVANRGLIPSWKILEDRSGDSIQQSRLPFRASTIDAGREMLAAVITNGTARRALHFLPEGVAAFGKTGTANGNEELLMVGFTEGLVVAMWVGHQGDRRRIHEGALAGKILAGHWGRVARIAIEGGATEGSHLAGAPSDPVSTSGS